MTLGWYCRPMASKALEYFKAKDKSVVANIGVLSMEKISQVLTVNRIFAVSRQRIVEYVYFGHSCFFLSLYINKI